MKARATCNVVARYLWKQSLCIRPNGFTLVELLDLVQTGGACAACAVTISVCFHQFGERGNGRSCVRPKFAQRDGCIFPNVPPFVIECSGERGNSIGSVPTD